MGNGMRSPHPVHCSDRRELNNYCQVDKRDDPYAPQQSNGCCIVM